MSLRDIPEIDMRAKLAMLEAQDVKDPSPWEVRKRILDRHANGKAMTGLTLPWGKTHGQVRLRPGEVSVWAGFNAHNKSTLLSQVGVWAAQEARVAVASFEMELEDTYNLMARQAAGGVNPDPRWVNDFLTWCQDRIYVYDMLDSVPAQRVLSAVDYMAETLKCGVVVIDSLMMVRGVVDDMEREREFVSMLAALAKHYKIHIALAHHMRKPQHGDESYIPNKFDLRGSGGIADIAHTIFICWNNKARKQIKDKLDSGIPLTSEEGLRWEREEKRPDQLLIVAKQRHAEFEGPIALWQHPSRQFIARERDHAAHIDIPRLEATA